MVSAMHPKEINDTFHIAKKGRLWICLVLYCQSPESCSKNNEPLYFTLQDTLVQSAFAFVFDFSVLLGDNLNWFFSDSQQAFRARISLCSRTTLVEIATQSTTWIDLLSNIIIFKGRTIRFLKGGGGGKYQKQFEHSLNAMCLTRDWLFYYIEAHSTCTTKPPENI